MLGNPQRSSLTYFAFSIRSKTNASAEKEMLTLRSESRRRGITEMPGIILITDITTPR